MDRPSRSYETERIAVGQIIGFRDAGAEAEPMPGPERPREERSSRQPGADPLR